MRLGECLRKVLVLITVVFSLLLLTSLLTFNIGPAGSRRQRERGSYRIFPKDSAHWLGWVGLFLLAVSASYSALKKGFPTNLKLWFSVHCVMGTLSIVFVAFHLINKIERMRPSYFVSFFAFFLMVVIVVGGILGRYVRVRVVKEYWRTLHIPLTMIFYFVLAFHILEKMNFLW